MMRRAAYSCHDLIWRACNSWGHTSINEQNWWWISKLQCCASSVFQCIHHQKVGPKFQQITTAKSKNMQFSMPVSGITFSGYVCRVGHVEGSLPTVSTIWSPSATHARVPLPSSRASTSFTTASLVAAHRVRLSKISSAPSAFQKKSPHRKLGTISGECMNVNKQSTILHLENPHSS